MVAGLAARIRALTIRVRPCRITASAIRRWPRSPDFFWPKPIPICSPTCISTRLTPEQITHGKRLVSDYGCASCHEIAGIKKPENFAPELSRIGSKPVTQLVFLPGMQHTLPDYIATKIKQPRSFGQGLKMPQYTFTPAQIDSLTTALLSLNDRSNTLPPSLAVAAARESDYQPAGKAGKLMTDLACFSCHRINGHGGDMAPDLTWEGQLRAAASGWSSSSRIRARCVLR